MPRASSIRFVSSRALVRVTALCALLVGARVGAQVPTTRPDTTRRDSTRARPTVPAATSADSAAAPTTPAASDTTRPRPPRRPRAGIEAPPRPRPPISPRRALLYSLALPGYGQSRLDRHATGAFFFAVEAASFAMVTKSAFDLAEARAYRGDSLIATRYPVDSATGLPQTVGSADRTRSQFTNALVRSRRLHLEDWLATLAFNHLISGAEAFVSANLWEVQTQISARPSDRGAVVALSLAW